MAKSKTTPSQDLDSDGDLKDVLQRVKQKLRVTKVVATRAVKSRSGDTFAGFSAAWESVQDDGGGPGADLIDGGINTSESMSQGMTFAEARLAHYLLAMQTDIAATEAAMASGNITSDRCDELVRMYKNNYAKLIRHAMGQDDSL